MTKIAISVGDPAGIGPEITIKAINNLLPKFSNLEFFIVGPLNIIEYYWKSNNCSFEFNVLNQKNLNLESKVNIIDIGDYPISDIGSLNQISGKLSFEAIEIANSLILEGKCDALVTAPINKITLSMAKINFIGHTEILKFLTNTKEEVFTVFELSKLRVFFLTRHIPLKDVSKNIIEEKIIHYLRKMSFYSTTLFKSNKPIAVAGLNPHCGDNGLIGTEEKEIIIPAIKKAQQEGINVIGPVPADFVFYNGKKGHYSSILSLYHDQGHIGTKSIDFYKTISLTLGLPYIRTSPDHGTAFDIAGMNIANPVSMIQSIKAVIKYSKRY